MRRIALCVAIFSIFCLFLLFNEPAKKVDSLDDVLDGTLVIIEGNATSPRLQSGVYTFLVRNITVRCHSPSFSSGRVVVKGRVERYNDFAYVQAHYIHFLDRAQ